LNTMFSASSSLTWAGVGLPDSRSLRKGCICDSSWAVFSAAEIEQELVLAARPPPVHGPNAMGQGLCGQLVVIRQTSSGYFFRSHSETRWRQSTSARAHTQTGPPANPVSEVTLRYTPFR